MSSRKESEKKSGCYFVTALSSFLFVMLVKFFWPHAIPFELTEFVKFEGTVAEVFKVSLPIFIWGVGVTGLAHLLTQNDPSMNRKAERLLGVGFVTSTVAGIFEEISYRWFLFFSAIIGLQILDTVFLGFAGIHIVQGFYMSILVPVANFFTLGLLEPQLYSPLGWAVGAAIISSNGNFRNGHAYLGLFGYVNSWFIGMFMFYLMFQYGLLAAILVHFLYDMFIFIVMYVDAAIERQMGIV